MAQIPGWLRAAFVAVMLLACAVLCWFAPTQYALRFQRDDLALSLETSRQREAKQRYEDDQVASALPETVLELERTQPLADEASAAETALRTSRKALREENAALEEQLTAALAAQAEAEARRDALRQETERLTAQQEALSRALEALDALR